MKRAMAATGAVLLLVGAAVSWTGARLGGSNRASVRMFGREWTVYVPTLSSPGGLGIAPGGQGRTEETAVSQGEATEPFRAVNIDVDMADVTLVQGAEYSVQVDYWGRNYKVFWENQDGGLCVWSEGVGVPGVTEDTGCNITITVPQPLDRVDLDLDLGNVSMEGIAAECMALSLDLGSVTARNLTVAGELDVQADLGSVDLHGDLGERVEVKADLGEVTVRLTRPADDYCWDLHADLGRIRVDGRDAGNVRATGGTGEREVLVEASLGSISVDFDCPLEVLTGVVYRDTVYREAVAAPVEEETYTGAIPSAPTAPAAPAAPAVPTPLLGVVQEAADAIGEGR